jgi:hypothetical protein
MSYQRLPPMLMAATCLILLVVGCGAPAAAPSAAPSDGYTLATSAEEVVGTWTSGSRYRRIDNDGTYRSASALDRLESQPDTITSYQFEGTKMIVEELWRPGGIHCVDTIGRYEVRLLESGSIQIVLLEDECTARAASVAKEYEPVR